jgi:hypothetical protein
MSLVTVSHYLISHIGLMCLIKHRTVKPYCVRTVQLHDPDIFHARKGALDTHLIRKLGLRPELGSIWRKEKSGNRRAMIQVVASHDSEHQESIMVKQKLLIC